MKLALGSPFLLKLLGNIAIATDLLIETFRLPIDARMEEDLAVRRAG